MINKPPAFKGLNIRIPVITPTKWRRCINQGSTATLLGSGALGCKPSSRNHQPMQIRV